MSKLTIDRAFKSDNFTSSPAPESQKNLFMIQKVGAGPRSILPSEPTAIPVAIIWALSL